MDHNEAWDAIHDRLPVRWRVAPPTFNPATRLWSVTALSPTPGRRKVSRPPEYVVGEGADELAALRDLAERLRARSPGVMMGAVDDLIAANLDRQRGNLERILVKEGWAPQRARELVAEWDEQAALEGIEPSPDYVGKGLRWLAEKHPRKL